MSERAAAAAAADEAQVAEAMGAVWPAKGAVARIRQAVLAWYAQHARQLPWRADRDPYAIWISETMLQQTQVATVAAYFPRFVQRFPTVHQLAAAPETEVLKLWEGLGYYRRARALHAAAQQVVERFDGVFPRDLAALQSLPGVGRYTAGAIASIAFDVPAGIVEANTQRLLSRLLALPIDPRRAAAQKLLWRLAAALVPRRDAGRFNQGLMELGALVCTPQRPACTDCPLLRCCPTAARRLQDAVPVRAARPEATPLEHTAVVLLRGSRVLLVQRQAGEWWSGLWDFPRYDAAVVHATQRLTPESLAAWQQVTSGIRQQLGLQIEWVRPLTTLRHAVTRYRITVHCHLARVQGGRLHAAGRARWVGVTELAELPLSAPARRIARLIA